MKPTMNAKKIAICSVQIPFTRGGAEILIDSLHKELLKRNFNVDVINIPFKWYPVSRIITECLVWRLMDLSEVDGKRIDIVIGTKFPSTVIKHTNKRIWLIHQLRQAYDLFGTEFSFFDHTEDHNNIRDMINEIDNITIREAKKVFTISQNVSRRLKKYNNIDSVPLYPPPRHYERFYNEDYHNYILYIGRLDPNKRVELLVEAFQYVKSNVKCRIVGTGSEKDRLSAIIDKHRLHDRVKLMGYLSDDKVFQLYANALAVFYAPFDEDYGFATLEAFLSKKPVITTSDSGGVLEFVIDEENGFVVNKNPESIAEKFDDIFNNKTVCKKLGSCGYEIAKKITWDKIIEHLID